MELILENGIAEVKASEYEGNGELVKVRIPASVVKIGRSAFKGCVNLKEVEFEDGPKPLEIGESAFEGCKALCEVNLPGRASRFLRACFKDSGLERMTIGQEGDFIASQDLGKFAGCPGEKALNDILETERLRRVRRLIDHPRTSFRCGEEVPPEKRKEFEKFWSEHKEWRKIDGDEEEITMKRGRTKYTLRCRWDNGTLVIGMIYPWTCDWDYLEMFAGMYGWANRGAGFHCKATRKNAVRLLLDEIIRRNNWLQGHPSAVAKKELELANAQKKSEQDVIETKGELDSLVKSKDSMSEEDFNKAKSELEERLADIEYDQKMRSRPWYANYRWARYKAAGYLDGPQRLYIRGVNHILGSRIECMWALRDM